MAILSKKIIKNRPPIAIQIVHSLVHKLGFPRQDVPGQSRTGCPVVPGQKNVLVPPSLCPRTKKNPCPAVPLSRDKSSIKNPRTNFSVPGRPGPKKIVSFYSFFPSVPWSSRDIPGWDRLSKSRPGPSLGKIAKPCPVPRPSLDFDWLSRPSRPVARFWACPVVPLSRDNKGSSVPLSQKVALSRPVGNPNINPLIKSLLATTVPSTGGLKWKSLLICDTFTLVSNRKPLLWKPFGVF
jgi:hypothetical protein